MLGTRRGEALFGAVLLGVGLFAIYKASALPAGTLREPDAGLFPISIGVMLTLLAVFSLASRIGEGGSLPAERAGVVRVVVLIAAVAVYAWLLPRIGFIVCTFALLVLILRGLGGVRWLGTTVSAAIGTAACYLLFTRLGLPLPTGWIGF